MTLEQDYRVLARFLVKTHGDGALDYTRRYADSSPDQDDVSGEIWRNVTRAVEELMARNMRRRESDCVRR